MRIVRTEENLASAKAKHAAAQVKDAKAQQTNIRRERHLAAETRRQAEWDTAKKELKLQQAKDARLKEAARLEALTPEQRYQADWDADPRLREEFRGDFKVYALSNSKVRGDKTMSEKSVNEMTEEEIKAEHARLKELERRDQLGLEGRAKEDWNADPAIRAEFRQFETYLAFRAAEASGRVQIIGNRVVTA